MMRAILAAGFAIAFAFPSQVAAQQSGSRIVPFRPAQPSGDREDVDEARRVARAFADCTVARSPRLVEAARQVDFMQDLSGLASSECLLGAGGSLRIPQPLMRGELYGALYRRDTRVEPTGFDPAPIDFSVMRGDARSAALRAIGECTVRADPVSAHRLAVARIGSAEERALFRSVAAAAGPCVPEGQSITFSRPMIAGVVMEGLYHLSTKRALPVSGRN